MPVDISDALKYSLDVCYEQPARLGLHPYSITAIVITNTGGSRPGVGGTRVRTDTRILLFDGYENGSSKDGYLNPKFEQVTGQDVFLSGNVLTDKDYKVGPLVYPYSYDSINQGTDFRVSNPVYSSDNTQLYFYVVGPAFPNGQYFKRFSSKEDSALAYTLFIRLTNEIPAP
jgi:hypothetical protein